jgi:L-2-hydroxyglutarate oxidase LhgO
MRVVVVGAGIVGLAGARAILAEHPGAEVVVLEKEIEVGVHQTGHNSGVVHAGLYYRPGSLKARLCRRGVALLKEYCAARGIHYNECGKVLVATSVVELARLDGILQRAEENGVPRVKRLGAAELSEIEPHVVGLGGLVSPTTAIVDFREVARRFAEDVQQGGGVVRFGAAVVRINDVGKSAEVMLSSGAVERADRVLVCAGLYADRLARRSGRPADPRIVPFRGEYYALRPDRGYLVRGLIYPVPDPSLPFLGVHLTRTVDRGVLIGPNAVLAFKREGYRRRDFSFRDVRETLGWPGVRRVVAEHWRVGAAEAMRSASRRMFVREARRYVPQLAVADVSPVAAGVRAQAVSRSGALMDDFVLDSTRNVVWVRNAPSPAATSSMAIAEELLERLAQPRLN